MRDGESSANEGSPSMKFMKGEHERGIGEHERGIGEHERGIGEHERGEPNGIGDTFPSIASIVLFHSKKFQNCMLIA